jgi:ribonuclease HIII
MSDLNHYKNIVENYFAENDISISDAKEIPYGYQFSLLDNIVKLNLWFGKKGFSFTVQSKDKSAKQQLEEELQLLFFSKQEKERADGLMPIYDHPWIGTDESGKGDYFGPLVCAGVCLTKELADYILTKGVGDSKKFSDSKIKEMSKDIEKLGRTRTKVLMLKPEKYNELYDRFSSQKKNLNHLMAWMHGKVVEDLIDKNGEVPLVVIDKFGRDSYMEPYFSDYKKTKLLLVTKAEYNMAVAAASIIARKALLDWHEQVKGELGYALPFGASGAVKSSARRLVDQFGMDDLGKYAKLHFKTTQEL